MQLLLWGVTCALTLSAGATKKDPARQFDFWVGTWKCSGEMHPPNGKITSTKASNHITSDMSGHVIHEHFKMQGLNGESFSVYNSQTKVWQQTWVDDSGSYIALKGGFEDGKMTLATEPQSNGRMNRMVFHNITPKSFDWDWEGSPDSGKTWNLRWHLHYERAGK